MNKIIICLLAVISVFAIVGRTSAASPSATLYISPSSQTVTIGASIAIDIKLTSPTTGVAGVTVKISHSSALQYNSFDASGSIFDYSVTPPTDNNGTITFTRMELSAGGWTGTSGQIIRLNFVATETGTATISISQNDSLATAYSDSSNILQGTDGGSYTIASSQSSSAASSTSTPTSASSTSSTSTISKTTATPKSAVTTKPATTPTANPIASISAEPTTDTNTALPSTLTTDSRAITRKAPLWPVYSAGLVILALMTTIAYLVTINHRHNQIK